MITRIVFLSTVALAGCALALGPAVAQQSPPAKKSATAKAGKGQKECRVKLQYSGEVKTWVCKTEEPCCVWHEINYVKCGSTVTGCL
jgi:hypothetical protein